MGWLASRAVVGFKKIQSFIFGRSNYIVLGALKPRQNEMETRGNITMSTDMPIFDDIYLTSL